MKGTWKELREALWYLDYQKQTLMVIWLSQTAYQDVNQGPAKGNTDCKGNHDAMGKMEVACEIGYYVTPWGYRGCARNNG